MKNIILKSIMAVVALLASLLAGNSEQVTPSVEPNPGIPGQTPSAVQTSQSKPGDADFPQLPCERHNKRVKAIHSGNYELVLIGDSITESMSESGGEYEPIKTVWKKYYEPRKAINLGCSGYCTQNILWNILNGELEFTKSPKVFRILIGTNNLNDEHNRQIHTAEQVFAGTKAIVDQIRAKLPDSKILIQRILPAGGPKDKTTYHRSFHRSDGAIKALRSAGLLTRTLADGEHVFWLDVNYVFTNPDGTINFELMPDLLHPNTAGHEAMAQAIEPELARLMGDMPKINENINPAVIPLPNMQENGDDWFRRHSESIKRGKQLHPEVILIGDDITYNCGGDSSALFKHIPNTTTVNVFGDIRALNLGFSGDRTENVLWRIDHGELDDINPNTVVLQIGTNNTIETKSTRPNTAQEIFEGIRACVIRIRAKLPDSQIILMSVFLRDEKPEHPRRKLIAEVNKLLLDNFRSLPGMTLVNMDQKYCNPDGTLSSEMTIDFWHLNEKGYKIWADNLLPMLKQN